MKQYDQNQTKAEMAYIFGGIFALANRLQLIGDRFLERISIKQWFLLAVISKFEQGAPTIGQVAQVIGNSRQNIKKMASILEKQGLLYLKRDETDSRIIRLYLSDECRQFSIQQQEREGAFLNQLFLGFDQEFIGVMFKGFQMFENNILSLEKIYIPVSEEESHN